MPHQPNANSSFGFRLDFIHYTDKMIRPALSLSFAIALAAVALSLPHSGQAQDRKHDPREREAMEWAPEFEEIIDDSRYRLIPLRRAVEIATARFDGRVIAARLLPPTADEREHGTVLVHELRLMTRNHDVLRIRLDARNGSFLEVAGAGLAKARRKGQYK